MEHPISHSKLQVPSISSYQNLHHRFLHTKREFGVQKLRYVFYSESEMILNSVLIASINSLEVILFKSLSL